jgi:Cu+-exporting ATPase
MERDTVCGMEVSKASKYKSEANGKVYLFCSAECKSKFDANPVKYAR